MKKKLVSSLLAVVLTGIAGAAAAQIIDQEELKAFDVPEVQVLQELPAGRHIVSDGFLIIGHAGGQKCYALKIGLDRELPVKLFMDGALTNLQKQIYSVVGLAAKFGLQYSSIGRPTRITLQNGWATYQLMR